MKSDDVIIAKTKEDLARKRAARDLEKAKREVQAEIAKSFHEDAINAALHGEIYAGFGEWYAKEKEKERAARRKR